MNIDLQTAFWIYNKVKQSPETVITVSNTIAAIKRDWESSLVALNGSFFRDLSESLRVMSQ